MSSLLRASDRTLQEALETQLRDIASPPILLAGLLELKLRKARVRLTKIERERLQRACKTYLKTEDESVLRIPAKADS